MKITVCHDDGTVFRSYDYNEELENMVEQMGDGFGEEAYEEEAVDAIIEYVKTDLWNLYRQKKGE